MSVTHVRKPATLINIAYFTTLLIGVLAFSTAYFYNESHAMSVSYREKLCERNFYGSNYKPYLEKTCGLFWQKWTYDILNTHE